MPLKLLPKLSPNDPARIGKEVHGAVKHIQPVPGAKPKLMLKRTDIVTKPKPQKAIDEKVAKGKAAEQVARDEDTCLANLSHLEDFVKVQTVTLPNNKEREWPVVSPTAASPALNTTAVSISRWLKAGLLPEPILETGRTNCWHLEELRSIVTLLGQHFKTHKQYRDKQHDDLKAKIFEANVRIRKSLLSQAV